MIAGRHFARPLTRLLFMLVLGRKEGERIIITVGLTRIEIVVVDIDRGRIRLGFEAGETVIIKRAELEGQADPNERD